MDGIAEQMAAADISGSRRTAAKTMSGPGQSLNPGKNATAARKLDVDPSVREKTFAERIGKIFSAMYNVFVDEGVLKMIRDSARRLAAYAGSPAMWSSSDIARCVTFADDRTRVSRPRHLRALLG